MRRKSALNLDPTIFPKKMKTTIVNGQQMATTADIARYVGTIHTEVHCVFGAAIYQLSSLIGIEDLNKLATEFDCENINLTLQDNIDLQSDDGCLIDQFSYALTLRYLERSDLLNALNELLQQRQEIVA